MVAVSLKKVLPTTHYPIHDAAVAIRLVGGAGHTGKVVLDVPRTGEGVAVVPPEQVRTSLFSSRRRHTRLVSDWSSDVCSSDLEKRDQ